MNVFKFLADVQWCSGVNMMAAPPIFVLMILALHLQCLLVDTISNDKSGSVMKKHLESPKHSAPRIKTSNKALNSFTFKNGIPADKKSGMHAL